MIRGGETLATSGEFQIGELVCSRAGRDKGRYYLVIALELGSFLKLVDGGTRRISNPKRKNAKHIVSTGQIAWEIAEKLRSNKRLTNSEVQKAIADLRATLECDWGSKEVDKPDGKR